MHTRLSQCSKHWLLALAVGDIQVLGVRRHGQWLKRCWLAHGTLVRVRVPAEARRRHVKAHRVALEGARRGLTRCNCLHFVVQTHFCLRITDDILAKPSHGTVLASCDLVFLMKVALPDKFLVHCPGAGWHLRPYRALS